MCFHFPAIGKPCEDPEYIRLKSEKSSLFSPQDSAAFVSKGALCDRYMDSVDTERLQSGRNEYKPKKDPANSLFATGFGALLLVGGSILYSSGESEKEECEAADGPLRICDIKQKMAVPVVGVGLLCLILGVVGLSQTTNP